MANNIINCVHRPSRRSAAVLTSLQYTVLYCSDENTLQSIWRSIKKGNETQCACLHSYM